MIRYLLLAMIAMIATIANAHMIDVHCVYKQGKSYNDKATQYRINQDGSLFYHSYHARSWYKCQNWSIYPSDTLVKVYYYDEYY